MRKRQKSKFLVFTLTFILLMTGVFTVSPANVFAATVGVVNVCALNLRSGASVLTPTKGVLLQGSSVEIAETCGDWYKVSANVNGGLQEGYVYARYVRVSQEENQQTPEMSVVSGNGIVNVSALNIRSMPSSSSSFLGTVGMGTPVSIVGRSDDEQWYKVRLSLYGHPLEAYVFAQYITLTEGDGAQTQNSGAVAAPGADAETFDAFVGSVDVYAVNLRSGASTSTAILGTLNRETEVEVIGQQDDWYQVRSGDLTGYLYASYVTYVRDLELDSENTDGSASGGDASTGKDSVLFLDTVGHLTGRVNKDGLVLRSGPSDADSFIAMLGMDTLVVINETADDWYAVTTTSDGEIVDGYLNAKYVTMMTEIEEKLETYEKFDPMEVSEEDEYRLACVVYFEAGNQCYDGKLAVANVVLNRVRDPLFPDTILDVIAQPGQFSPYYTGSFDGMLEDKTVPEPCLQAARDALSGINNVPGYYFFTSAQLPSDAAGYLVIQDHIFYHY